MILRKYNYYPITLLLLEKSAKLLFNTVFSYFNKESSNTFGYLSQGYFLMLELHYNKIVSNMAATQITNFKCPGCLNGHLTQVDRMVRCTCGWWIYAEENEDDEISIQSVEFIPVVAS